jgi:hypothetical protein
MTPSVRHIKKKGAHVMLVYVVEVTPQLFPVVHGVLFVWVGNLSIIVKLPLDPMIESDAARTSILTDGIVLEI